MGSVRMWTREEVELLRNEYPRRTAKELAQLLGRTPVAIRIKARSLRLIKHPVKRWTPDEIRFLEQNYGKMPIDMIAEILGRTRWSVKRKAERLRREGKKLYQGFIRTLPDLSPSKELAYIIGVVLGDGSIFVSSGRGKKQYAIKLSARDKDFVEAFAKALEKVCRRKRPLPIRLLRRHGYWETHIYSKRLYEFLNQPLEKLEHVIKAYPEDFLRGFFDSEGSVKLNITRRKRKKHVYVMITCANTNYKLLQFIADVLKYVGIKITGIYTAGRRKSERHKQCYTLVIARSSEVKKFAIKIGFTIKRKRRRLEECLSLMRSSQ